MLWEPKYCNCIFWGFYVKIMHGAKLKITTSSNWDVKGGNWHIICVFKNGEVRSYVPVDEKPITSWLDAVKIIIFEGKITDEYGQGNRKIAG